MNKVLAGIAITLLLLALTCFRGLLSPDAPKMWGSFTNQPVTSSDGKVRAEYSAVDLDGYNVSMIQVAIYDNITGELLDSFVPARAMDFWGICFEEGTHSIWTQSADIGIHCYVRNGDKWMLDEDAIRPEGIVSKWDKKIASAN